MKQNSGYHLDSDFDTMPYDFIASESVPEIYRGDYQLLCRILLQWIEDLTSWDEGIRRAAIAWVSNKKEVDEVCGWIGLNPQIVKRFAREKTMERN